MAIVYVFLLKPPVFWVSYGVYVHTYIHTYSPRKTLKSNCLNHVTVLEQKPLGNRCSSYINSCRSNFNFTFKNKPNKCLVSVATEIKLT